MKNLTLIVLISIFLCECRKDKSLTGTNGIIPQYDTLKPLNYYPIYPGSYWKYLRNDTDTIVFNASQTYIKHNYIKWQGFDNNGNWVKEYSDTVYVPFLNNNPIYQYNKIEHILPPLGDFYITWPIVSEEVGFIFNREWNDPRLGDYNEKVVVKQKTVNSKNDSVIILRGHWMNGASKNCISIQEYTKNIGLSSHIKIDTVSMDTIYKLQLIDYHINK